MAAAAGLPWNPRTPTLGEPPTPQGAEHAAAAPAAPPPSADAEKKKPKKKYRKKMLLLQMGKSGGAKKNAIAHALLDSDDDSDSDEDEDDSDASHEEKPTTADTHHVAWLPSCWSTIQQRVRDHCLCGRGESNAVRRRLNLGNTSAGNLKIS
ncbi:MAG: hypothetical protein VX670_12265, partial [Candidatus Latescibacterota bacterium]|nr:hypothetical protein [Candidatus Latescibacterota bacterium]